MDPLRIHAYKIQAINECNRQQFVNNLVLYSLTTFLCTLFCASPLWYPPLCATFNVFVFLSLPKITSIFVGPKVLFIIGNLIIIFLVGESKILKPKSTSYSACDVYYNKHMGRRKWCSLERDIDDRKHSLSEIISTARVDQGGYWRQKIGQGEIKVKDGLDEDVGGSAEDLNKLADDFIARVIRRRRLEAQLSCRG